MDVLLEQFLVGRIELGVGIGLVEIAIDQIDGDAQIVFGEDLVAIVAFQGGGIVLDEAIVFEWVRNEF